MEKKKKFLHIGQCRFNSDFSNSLCEVISGPGDAPSNINLIAERPRLIQVEFEPPMYPNGNITRYIIYYVPLDDQVSLVSKPQISNPLFLHLLPPSLLIRNFFSLCYVPAPANASANRVDRGKV